MGSFLDAAEFSRQIIGGYLKKQNVANFVHFGLGYGNLLSIMANKFLTLNNSSGTTY